MNVTDAAADLGVPSSDLRRLLWANPKLQDAAFEVVEGRLDLAEKNIAEALNSDDPRMRVTASMFTLRNSARARRRGWITTAAASVDVSVSAPRTITYRWRTSDDEPNDADGPFIERGGRKLAVPSYAGDDCFEGEAAAPAAMIEHAAAAAEPVVVEPEPDPAPEPVEPVVVELAADRYRREQVEAWIRNRLIAWPLASCFGCRKPIIAGAAWEEVSNGDTNARARFHRACHVEWRAGQEAAARQALGLEG